MVNWNPDLYGFNFFFIFNNILFLVKEINVYIYKFEILI